MAAILPPGPRNPPVIGNLQPFRKDTLNFLARVASHGDIAYFKAGPQAIYLFNDPEAIKEVFVTKAHNFTKSRVLQKAKKFLGEGLLTSEGQFHLRQRRLIQPAFHRDRLIGYGAAMTAAADRLRSRWRGGDTMDVHAEMTRLTLAVVAKTLFNADVEADSGEIGEALETILGLFETILLPFSELLEKLPLPYVKRYNKAKESLDAIIYRIIAERRASGDDKGDLLSMLLTAQDPEATGPAAPGMSDKQVRDEALTLFLAGHETTANALTWTWYLLSQNLECERRFHDELDSALAGRLPVFDDLPRLKYTEAVFAESMRLYPPAWALGRMALNDIEIGGYQIPARAIILMSPYITHRTAKYWPDPERFDPGRWTPEAAEARPKFTYYPFGGGQRVCVGERFAWMEGVLILATIAQKWRLRLVPGHPVAPDALITLRPKHGMRMTIESR